MRYRSLVTVLVFSAMVLPSFAQGPPHGRGRGGRSVQGSDVRARLQRQMGGPVLGAILDLTDAQEAAIRELRMARGKTSRALHPSLRKAQGKVKGLVKQGASAADIGNAVLSAAAIQQNISHTNKQFKTDFANVLTAAQNEKLAEIRKATATVRRSMKAGLRRGQGPRGGKPPTKRPPGL